MNIIYETTKERGATILIPSSMVDSMNPGAALVLANMAGIPGQANGAVKAPVPLVTPDRRADDSTAGANRSA